MNILFLEDRGSIFDPLKSKLEEEGYKVLKAIQVSDAKFIFREHEIDFLIIDLRVIPIGLTEDQIGESRSGRVSGWLFLKYYVLNENNDFRDKIIIFTEYSNELKQVTSPSDLKGIKIFCKKKSSIEQIRNYIKTVAKDIS